jgi:hypothetical protein
MALVTHKSRIKHTNNNPKVVKYRLWMDYEDLACEDFVITGEHLNKEKIREFLIIIDFISSKDIVEISDIYHGFAFENMYLEEDDLDGPGLSINREIKESNKLFNIPVTGFICVFIE